MTLQPVAVLFTDAEAWACSYLDAAIAARPESYTSGVIVVPATPNPRPASFVTVRRDGGPARGVFDFPRFGVNVWAETEEDATDLANLVAALFRVAPGDGTCTAVRQLSGPSPIADESGQPRRFLTFEATLRGGVLS